MSEQTWLWQLVEEASIAAQDEVSMFTEEEELEVKELVRWLRKNAIFMVSDLPDLTRR